MDHDELNPSEYKTYWFARDLVASRFSGYATNEPEALEELSDKLSNQLDAGADVDSLKKTLRDHIRNSINKLYGGDISKKYRQTEDMTERILYRIEDREDVEEFIIAARAVVRTSRIMQTTPSFGEDEIYEIVDDTLEGDDGTLDATKAFDALFLVDVDGEAYQLGAQRAGLINYLRDLFENLQNDPDWSETDVIRIVSGIIQEYERRAGQSRTATAGNVLETGLQHVFDRFGIPATGVPKHFGDLEVDNIVDGPDATIGFSCKRTLRERFKQSLARQSEIGADEVWFVSLMMSDISREKLQIISNDGGRIYVPRESFVWEQYGEDDELSYALRPADEFLSDVAEFSGCQLSEEVKAN